MTPADVQSEDDSVWLQGHVLIHPHVTPTHRAFTAALAEFHGRIVEREDWRPSIQLSRRGYAHTVVCTGVSSCLSCPGLGTLRGRAAKIAMIVARKEMVEGGEGQGDQAEGPEMDVDEGEGGGAVEVV